MTAPLCDLAEVTTDGEILVDGHELWVHPGRTECGRYWQVLTPADVRLGLVVECDGRLAAVLDRAQGAAPTAAMEAVRVLLTQLCAAVTGGAS